MPGARGPTPLFEVLAERARAQNADKPQPSPGVDAPRADRSPAEPADPRPATFPSGKVEVPLPTVYVSIAAVLLLCVLMYLVGYRVGFDRAERDLEGIRPLDMIPITDPLQDERTTGDPDPRPTAGPPPTNRSGSASPPPGSRSAPNPRSVLGVGGAAIEDPRLGGNNYLELAVLSAAQAEEALAFLDGAGIRAIGVPVDRGGSATNNPVRYRIVSLELAIPSGRFSALDAEKRRVEQRLRDLGRRWVSEGGWSDFRDPLWRRHDP